MTLVSIRGRLRRARERRALERLFSGAIAPPKALTCKGKTDGAGAQLHAQLSVIAFCRAAGMHYLHTPLSKVEHTTTPEEVSAWEGFLRLSDFAHPAADSGLPEVNLLDFTAGPAGQSAGVIAVAEHLHKYLDWKPHIYEPLQPKLRQAAFMGHKAELSAPTWIALHVRRGDLDLIRHKDRYTHNAQIIARLRTVSERYPDASGTSGALRLFSQGDAVDFADVTAAFPDIELHLDTPPIETIRGLANSRNLMMARSSFSYIAALLCEGRVIYEPFWHAPLPRWVALR